MASFSLVTTSSDRTRDKQVSNNLEQLTSRSAWYSCRGCYIEDNYTNGPMLRFGFGEATSNIMTILSLVMRWWPCVKNQENSPLPPFKNPFFFTQGFSFRKSSSSVRWDCPLCSKYARVSRGVHQEQSLRGRLREVRAPPSALDGSSRWFLFPLD